MLDSADFSHALSSRQPPLLPRSLPLRDGRIRARFGRRERLGVRAGELGFELFDGLPHTTVDEILRAAPVRTIPPGETVLAANAANRFIFLIESGEAGIWTGQPHARGGVLLGTLGAGAEFGEVSAIYGEPVTTAVVAHTELKIRMIDLDAVPGGEPTRQIVTRNATHSIIGLLTQLASSIQSKHESEVRALHIAGQASGFVMRLLMGLALYMLGMPAFSALKAYLPSDSIISGAIIVAFFAMSYDFVRRNGIEPASLFMTRQHARQQVWRAVAWVVPFMAAYVVAKQWLKAPDHPLFEPMSAITAHSGQWEWWLLFATLYLVLSFAQEFIRCTVQGTLDLIAVHPSSGSHWKSIIVSDVVFASLHMHLGGVYAGLAFVAGLILGYQYWRARSFLTVAISHAVFGLWVVFIVGVPQ